MCKGESGGVQGGYKGSTRGVQGGTRRATGVCAKGECKGGVCAKGRVCVCKGGCEGGYEGVYAKGKCKERGYKVGV